MYIVQYVTQCLVYSTVYMYSVRYVTQCTVYSTIYGVDYGILQLTFLAMAVPIHNFEPRSFMLVPTIFVYKHFVL
jgi:hypothetical protein